MATLSKIVRSLDILNHGCDSHPRRYHQLIEVVVPFTYCSMKLHLLLGCLVALCTVKKQSATISSETLCDLWANNSTRYEYDMVAVTDDYSYGHGRGEDMTFVRAVRKLGRKVTRISIHEDDFDWNTYQNGCHSFGMGEISLPRAVSQVSRDD
jgi:FAD synthase